MATNEEIRIETTNNDVEKAQEKLDSYEQTFNSITDSENELKESIQNILPDNVKLLSFHEQLNYALNSDDLDEAKKDEIRELRKTNAEKIESLRKAVAADFYQLIEKRDNLVSSVQEQIEKLEKQISTDLVTNLQNYHTQNDSIEEKIKKNIYEIRECDDKTETLNSTLLELEDSIRKLKNEMLEEIRRNGYPPENEAKGRFAEQTKLSMLEDKLAGKMKEKNYAETKREEIANIHTNLVNENVDLNQQKHNNLDTFNKENEQLINSRKSLTLLRENFENDKNKMQEYIDQKSKQYKEQYGIVLIDKTKKEKKDVQQVTGGINNPTLEEVDEGQEQVNEEDTNRSQTRPQKKSFREQVAGQVENSIVEPEQKKEVEKKLTPEEKNKKTISFILGNEDKLTPADRLARLRNAIKGNDYQEIIESFEHLKNSTVKIPESDIAQLRKVMKEDSEQLKEQCSDMDEGKLADIFRMIGKPLEQDDPVKGLNSESISILVNDGFKRSKGIMAGFRGMNETQIREWNDAMDRFHKLKDTMSKEQIDTFYQYVGNPLKFGVLARKMDELEVRNGRGIRNRVKKFFLDRQNVSSDMVDKFGKVADNNTLQTIEKEDTSKIPGLNSLVQEKEVVHTKTEIVEEKSKEEKDPVL